MNINKDMLKRKLELALNNEITTTNEGDEYIPIDDEYQKMLDRIVNIIMSS